jgi:hypothetical protein
MKWGQGGESFLREQTARVRQRNQNQDPPEEVEGPRNHPRHKFKTVHKQEHSEVLPNLATLSRRPETQAAMVL